jgi:ADP-heptose:LPS heptosyltransferase
LNSGLDYSAIYNILVIQIGRIGDMILTTPLFPELKKLFPNSTLTVLANPTNCDVIKSETAIDRILIYKKDVINIVKLITKLKKEHFDIWIDPKYGYSKTSEFLLKICKPKQSFGYNLSKVIFNTAVQVFDRPEHYINLCLNFLKCFCNDSANYENQKPIIRIPEAKKKKYGSSINYKIIAFNISAGNITRIWQKENWLKLINEINKLHPEFEFIMIYMDREKAIVKYITDNYKDKNLIYFSSKDIIEISDLISNVNLVITPDTSLVHIASAFNIPIIALYPNVKWNYERFSPKSDIQEVIISDSEKDIFNIKTEEVLSKFTKIIRRI